MTIVVCVIAICALVTGIHDIFKTVTTLSGSSSKQDQIEQVVAKLKRDTVFPEEVNASTTLINVEVEPNAIRFDGLIHDTDVSNLTNDDFKKAILFLSCNDVNMSKIFVDSGISLEYSYTVKDSSQKFFVSVNGTDCSSVSDSAQTSPSTGTTSILLESQPYSNTQHGFTIDQPSGWQIDESQSGAIVVFSSTRNSFADLTVESKSIEQGVTLDDYAEAVISGLPKLDNSALVDNKTVDLSGVPGRLITVSSMIISDNLKINIIRSMLITVKNDQAYLIMSTIPKSDWDQYKDMMEASLLTFKFI